MLSSLKKWVQDVAVDLAPPPVPPPPLSSTSPPFLSSSAKSEPAHHYYYSTAPSHERYRHDYLSTNSILPTKCLSRPTSMDSVRSSRLVTTPLPPPLASPVDLDLSHLNREEQEHIANVLRRAKAADEQQQATIIPPSGQSPPASIVSASLSTSSSSSSSSSSLTSTSSFIGEKTEKYGQNDQNDNNDDNEISRNYEELPSSSAPESTSIPIHRCQVCNKEQQQQQGNPTICLQCQSDSEIARGTHGNTISFSSARNSSSSPPLPTIEFDDYEDDQIYDNIMPNDQEIIEPNSPIEEYASYPTQRFPEEMNDNHGQDAEEEEEKQHQSFIPEDEIPTISSPVKTRSNNLTEIDEDDFFYQGPSPYTTATDISSVAEEIEEIPIPSYKIDEDIDEDDGDERDHVKELEETIANLTRHFPVSSQQINTIEIKPTVANLHQPTVLPVDKIDIDSILEMEIESPSVEEQCIPLTSSSIHPSTTTSSSAQPLNVPITVPISVSTRQGSLSRSSGVREHLTDLLVTTIATTTEPHVSERRPLQRTASTHSKHMTSMHRQKRNLPSVPILASHLQLRRANSESRFSLPAVPPPSIVIPNSNIDDESDLLEIDLNDPMGSMNRTARSKTESELNNSNDRKNHLKTFNTTNQSPSVDLLSSSNNHQSKQLRDQTTNTPPLSNFNSSIKLKKKLKKKGTPAPNDYQANSTHLNGHTTPAGISPTPSNPPAVILPPSPTKTTRPKLQKSTSTEMSYPFPVSKLILSRDNLNPSRRDGTDLGLQITGGHSIPNCMEVTACIEHIDIHHRNYHILKNAVEEEDEVLEVGGVSLRGKSALFVRNLMNSIEDEFEIVVRSKHVIPPKSPPVEIHKPERVSVGDNLTVSDNLSPAMDPHIQRRHSMNTAQPSPTYQPANTVVKSQSTIMSIPISDSNETSDRLLLPTGNRKKSVSSKERLFSVESLQRTASTKSIEHMMKVATQPSDTKSLNASGYYSPRQNQKPSIKPNEEQPTLPTREAPLSAVPPENKVHNDDPTSLSIPLKERGRFYEHRNSLLPNDPRLNGIGSNASMDRRNSNESDESDNLSQYFQSSSRKSSLMTTNDLTNPSTTDPSHQRSQSITRIDNDTATHASRRLQNFLKSSDETQRPRGSTDEDSLDLSQTGERKSSSGLNSFKLLSKKTKSVDLPNKAIEIRENDYVGDIELEIGHNSDGEQLVVRIIRAKNLLAKDTNGFSDPFVKVYLLPGRDQENKRRTKHISKTLNPVWEHTVIYGNMHREELQYKMLEFTLWDYDRFKANDFLGQVTIDLKDAKIIDDRPHWYRLQALRSREEATNRGSSPRLFQMTSVDSSVSSISASNKNTVSMQSRVNPRK